MAAIPALKHLAEPDHGLHVVLEDQGTRALLLQEQGHGSGGLNYQALGPGQAVSGTVLTRHGCPALAPRMGAAYSGHYVCESSCCLLQFMPDLTC